MKVLLVNSLYHPNVFGGAEKSVQLLAEALNGLGHEAVVVTLRRPGDAAMREVNGVRVQTLPLMNLYFPFPAAHRNPILKLVWHALDTHNPWMAQALGRVISAERPQVVNTHNLSGFSVSSWGEVKRRNLPLVHTARDLYLLCPRSTMFKAGHECLRHCATCRLYARHRRGLSKRVDLFTGVSRFILDRHAAYGYFTDARRWVTYNAYEAPVGKEVSRRGDVAGPLRFGFLGSLHPIKGVDRLIRAFATLPAGTAELWLAGSGTPDYERELKALAAPLDSVRWLGFVEAQELLSHIDMLVVPSLCHDTAPRVVLEAAAFGVPVLGANRGGIPELAAALHGWVFEPDIAGELERGLQRALTTRAELAEAGCRAQGKMSSFTLKASANRYIDAFETAMRLSQKTARR